MTISSNNFDSTNFNDIWEINLCIVCRADTLAEAVVADFTFRHLPLDCSNILVPVVPQITTVVSVPFLFGGTGNYLNYNSFFTQ